MSTPPQSGLWSRIKFESEVAKSRFKISRLVLEKIKESHIVIPGNKELEGIKSQMSYAMTAILVPTFFLVWKSKKLSMKMLVLGGGLTVTGLGVRPYYITKMIDSIAETQTEAGQLVRATYLFKMPKHPKTPLYESLSAEYRAYIISKREEFIQKS